jgi:hypothetical protein
MDVKNLPKWEPAMLEAEQTSPGSMSVGTTFRAANKVMGRRMAWTAKVTEYEPNRKSVWNITTGTILIEEHLNFVPPSVGSKFTQVYEVKVGGFLRLFTPMVVSTMRKQMKVNLANLKSILEAQA